MSDTLDPNAVDAALADTAKPVDTVSVPAHEILKLREAAREKSQLETDTAATFIDLHLSTALSGADLVPGAIEQLKRLWANDLVAKRVDGRWIVEGRAGGSVADVVRSRLNSAEYAHFVRAGSRGGAGGDATGSSPTGLSQGQQSYLQRVAAEIQARKSQGIPGRGVTRPK